MNENTEVNITQELRLYLLTDPDYNAGDYDEFDSAVVAACNEGEARKIHPSGLAKWDDEKERWDHFNGHAWRFPQKVECQYIGDAAEGIEKGVICSSFNAG